MQEDYIPCIDISPLVNHGVKAPQSAQTIAKIHQACQTVGFISIKNHGISAETISSMVRRAKEFFHLPFETKNKIACQKWAPKNQNTYRGYFPAASNGEGRQGLDLHDPLMKEVPQQYKKSNMYEADISPDISKQWRDEVQAYYVIMYNLALKLVQAFFHAFGRDQEWEKQKNHLVPRVTNLSTLRFNFYPDLVKPAINNEDNEVLSCLAHADSSLVTILYQDSQGGLQVKNSNDGKWYTVPFDPTAFVVNTGAALDFLTLGQYPATLHRVLKNYHQRISIPFFFEPQQNAILDPKYLNPESQVASKTYGQLLRSRLLLFEEYRRNKDESSTKYQ